MVKYGIEGKNSHPKYFSEVSFTYKLLLLKGCLYLSCPENIYFEKWCLFVFGLNLDIPVFPKKESLYYFDYTNGMCLYHTINRHKRENAKKIQF